MNVKRITRLLKLLQTLQSGSGQNVDGLAKSCGVSRRTMFRDLVALRASGVPIEYDSLTEWERITTKLRVYQLLFSKHSWYAIGRSSLHGEVRTFNVSRIVSLEMLSDVYSMPNGFSLERHFRNAWYFIPGPGPDDNVVIRFQPLVARNVAEVLWHKTQRLKFQDDGTLLFHARVSAINEIVWWILGYGDQAEVLQPLKLRRLVAHRARVMVERYDGKPKKDRAS